MPWKSIRDMQYYYLQHKIDGRVRSAYIGRGELAELMAARAESARLARAADSQRRRDERDRERELREWFERIESVANAAMVAAGYRKHHRSEWRKRRHDPGP